MQMALLNSLFTDNNTNIDIGATDPLLNRNRQPTSGQEMWSSLNSGFPAQQQVPPSGDQLTHPNNENTVREDIVAAMSWQVTVLGFIASLAIAINLSTCFVHLRFRGRRSNFSSVILAISSLDIVFVAAHLGLSIATFAEPTKPGADNYDDIGICTAGSIACRLVVLCPIIFILLESSFLAVGAFNRWLAISKPDVPHWVKGRTCLISIMALFLFLTIAVGINLVRDDIIMVRDPGGRSKLATQPTFNTIASSTFNNSATAPFNDYDGNNVFQAFSSSSNNGTAITSTSRANNIGITDYTFGCSILPSNTSLAVVSGISVFYFALITISIAFLVVTWFNIWSLLPLPTSDGICSLRKMVLRRKPQFVNSKFVDGYKIMWASLLLWIACSLCALAITLAPLSASLSSLCLTRRFVTSALLFLGTLFKCFLYIGFSFTFRRAIFETFVAPCCSRFYRTQNYVVARSSPFDRHMRVAVVVGRDYTNGRHHHHRHHHVSRHFLAEGDKQQPAVSPNSIPAILLPVSPATGNNNNNNNSHNGDLVTSNSVTSIFTRSSNYNQPPQVFTDPAACFDISDEPLENQLFNRVTYLSPFNNRNGAGISSNNNSSTSSNHFEENEIGNSGFTSLANLSASGRQSQSSRWSSGNRRIPIVIDDVTTSHENNVETIGSIPPVRNNNGTNTNSSNGRLRSLNVNNHNSGRSAGESRYSVSGGSQQIRDDFLGNHSDGHTSTSPQSPQPTSISMVGEEENKL